MKSKDDFDKFLIRKFSESKTLIEDNGFTERVLAGLPTKRPFSVSRNHILGLISMLSTFIFLVSGGFKLLTISIMNVLNNGVHLSLPAFSSVFVVVIFLCVPVFIGRVVYDESAV